MKERRMGVRWGMWLLVFLLLPPPVPSDHPRCLGGKPGNSFSNNIKQTSKMIRVQS